MPMPFFDEEFTFTQPDGTQFRVRGTGDQDSAVFETLDGYTIVQDPDSRYFHYAKLNADGSAFLPLPPRVGLEERPTGLAPKLRLTAAALPSDAGDATGASPTAWQMRIAARKSALNAGAAAPPRSITGDFIGLCLLIQFPDDTPDKVTRISQAAVDRYCNKRGYKEFGNWGSVSDYFHVVSDDKLNYTNIVAPYYTAKHPRAYYIDETIARRVRAKELVREALEHLKNTGFDASALTTDERNLVYAVNVLYTGARQNNWSQGLWPHHSHIEPRFELSPTKLAYDYQICDMTDELSLGTFCHENGHLLCDFPDLYDKTRNNEDKKSNGIGDFCLMCSGDRVQRRKRPVQVGAYLKHQAGWTSALHTMKPGVTISLQAGRNEFAIHTNPKRPTEYFIVESRKDSKQDDGLPGAGLAVWHVDELVNGNNWENMTPERHYECSLVQADGKYDLEKGENHGDEHDLYEAGGEISDDTQPNCKWWDGSDSALYIRDIRLDRDTATFSVAHPPAAVKGLGFLSRLMPWRRPSSRG